MLSFDRTARLLKHYGVFEGRKSPYPTHDLFDLLDEKAGINTRQGLTRQGFIGERIRRHERHAFSSYFWLGADAETE